MQESKESVVLVIIGRNEGERLKRCISSIKSQYNGPMIYVDSGSTDGSVAYAQSMGAIVVDLDMSIPFTMARGRNAGFNHLVELKHHSKYIQFVDADCELSVDWLSNGVSFLNRHIDISCVCGLLHERFPEKNIYHKILNMEWNSGYGEIDACGGIAMYRLDYLKKVGVFDETLIAGEEADLCLKIRNAGGKIWRLECQMGTHDANMNRFNQWWTRTVRGGHAFAEGFYINGKNEKKYKRRPLLSALFYGCFLPFVMIIGFLFSGWQEFSQTLGVLITLVYLRVFISLIKYRRKLKDNLQNAFLYASFILFAKIPESLGIFIFVKNKILGKTALIMEYRDDN